MISKLQRLQEDYFYALNRYRREHGHIEEAEFLRIRIDENEQNITELRDQIPLAGEVIRKQERIKWMKTGWDEYYSNEQFSDHVAETVHADIKKLNELINRMEGELVFYKLQLERLQQNSNGEQDDKANLENPYPHIFTSPKAWELFENLIERMIEDKKVAELSFFFRSMKRENFIRANVGNGAFIEFLQESGIAELDQLKTLVNSTTVERTRRYYDAKELTFKR